MANISDKTVGQIVSLATLAVGIAIGFVGGTLYRGPEHVQAQALVPPAPTVQEVSPVMMTGSIGTNLLLAHEIASDSLVVNGYDVLKLQNGVLQYLATRPLAEQADIQNIVNNSRATTVYRIRPPQPPAALCAKQREICAKDAEIAKLKRQLAAARKRNAQFCVDLKHQNIVVPNCYIGQPPSGPGSR